MRKAIIRVIAVSRKAINVASIAQAEYAKASPFVTNAAKIDTPTSDAKNTNPT